MKVLITGGAGFVGTHLAKSLLDDGASVTIVDNFQRGVKDTAFEEVASRSSIVDADLLSPTPVSRDELVRATGAPVAAVLAALTDLTLAGRAELLPGGMVTQG